MASTLKIPYKDFLQAWKQTAVERDTGILGDPAENIRHVGKTLGIKMDESLIVKAVAGRELRLKAAMTPRPDTVQTLKAIKQKGYKIGLISNISPPVPRLWPETPMAEFIESPIFSCAVGFMKPDQRIFKMACGQLDVSPLDCFYIGDGDSNELQAATALGMKAALIQIRYGDNPPRYRLSNTDWPGIRLLKLGQVLDHLDA